MGVIWTFPKVLRNCKDLPQMQIFIELPFKGINYTWTNNRDESCHIREKIDHVLVNVEWLELYPLSLLTYEPLIGYDHISLLLNTEPHQSPPKRSRFETMWMCSNQCEDLIKLNWKQCIDSTLADLLMNNLGACSSSLMKWSKECFKNYKLIIRSLTDRI